MKSLESYLFYTNVQLGASYDTSLRAAARVNEGLRAAALLMNAASTDEIVPGHSSTMVTENLSRAMGPTLEPGAEIIVTDFDHEANIGCWCRMAKLHGAVIRVWKINPATRRAEIDDLAQLLSPRTRLVACTQTSNITGAIVNVREIADLVHTIPGAEVLYASVR